jgi:hypothetical protein
MQMLHAAAGSRALSVEGRSPLPCVRSAPGTDRVREEGGHPLWWHDGQASLSSGCKKAGRIARAGQAGQACAYPSTPCVGSARDTDRVGKEEDCHPWRRNDGPASSCSGCKETGRIGSC